MSGEAVAAARANRAEAAELPEVPVVTIRASRSWAALDLHELWAYRELLYFFTWRDIKVRYKQAVLGIAWAVIQPLFTMVVFTVFFGKLAKVPSNGFPYPIFSYAALLPWTFLFTAVNNSGNSLVGSSNLIKKVYFPRMLVPGAAVAAALLDFAIAFAVFIGLFVHYRCVVTWQLVLLPVLVVVMTMFAVAIGLLVASLNVKYRDVRHALPFALQAWMFVSPVIYPSTLMEEDWRWILAVNPLTGIIEGYRSALLGQSIMWGSLSYSAAVSLVVLIAAAYSFRHMEREFADVV